MTTLTPRAPCHQARDAKLDEIHALQTAADEFVEAEEAASRKAAAAERADEAFRTEQAALEQRRRDKDASAPPMTAGSMHSQGSGDGASKHRRTSIAGAATGGWSKLRHAAAPTGPPLPRVAQLAARAACSSSGAKEPTRLPNIAPPSRASTSRASNGPYISPRSARDSLAPSASAPVLQSAKPVPGARLQASLELKAAAALEAHGHMLDNLDEDLFPDDLG